MEGALVYTPMLRICAICLLAAFHAAGADNSLTPAERAAGWGLLFDGTTTDGWTNATGEPFPHRSWVIRDGCLVAEPRNLNPESARGRLLAGLRQAASLLR